jgi:CheY-like chemotaxis protein
MATDSSPNPDPAGGAAAAALHRLRSALARVKAEIELAELEGRLSAPEVLASANEALARLTEAEEVVLANTAERLPPSASAVADARVLVADDDQRLAELTVRRLRREGYDAECVEGALALAVERMEAGDVLVADLGLLDELDERSRTAVRGVRPIVVTGAMDRLASVRAEEVAAFAYLIKPVEVTELLAAIRSRLEAEGR